MKQVLLITFLALISCITLNAQAVYVDGNTGNDQNKGTKEAPFRTIRKAAGIIESADNSSYTMVINPGIYVLSSHIAIKTKKDMTGKRITIEASIKPGDSLWTPEKMPIIMSSAPKGEFEIDYSFVAAFLIEESHVTFSGLKFCGYAYPNTRYFPILRMNKSKTDLWVEQCLFVGDKDASHLQVGILAHGDGIRADHCVFHNVRNSIVFWMNGEKATKTGNGITNSIIYGATQSGVWTAWPDKDFIFKNNIVANCKHFWIKNANNPSEYSMENCIVVNNQKYKVEWGNNGPVESDFAMDETHITKAGTIELVQKEASVHQPLPKDYLHVVKDGLGYGLGAGLFKK